jgi:hypothetical protein
MRNAAFACAAVSSLASTAVPMHAQSLTITSGNGTRYYQDHYRRPRHEWDGYSREWDRPHYRHAGCFFRTVEEHRHGRTVIREIHICR